MPSDRVNIYNLDTGEEFRYWKSVTIRESFLTPCASFSIEAGSELSATELAKKLPEGTKIKILINDHPQITGYVDATEVECSRGGSVARYSGRDWLSPLVDGSIDPRLQRPKDITIRRLLELVLAQFGIEFEYSELNTSRAKQVGNSKLGKGKPTKSRHKSNDPLKDTKINGQEGAFGYLGRILTYHGYWLWGDADGETLIVAAPTYDQPAAYQLISHYSPENPDNDNNVIRSVCRLDSTSTPSNVYVRGKDAGSGVKKNPLAMVENPLSSRFRPVYLTDNKVFDKAAAERIAKTYLARKLTNYLTYDVTLAGLSDPKTKNIYAVDTIANIDDSNCGVTGPMWIQERSFRIGRGGGETSLKLIPPGTLLLDWEPEDAIDLPVAYTEAETQAGKNAIKKTGKYSIGGVEFWRSKN